jgi:hypothetical protein
MRFLWIPLIAATISASSAARAEEGAAGHYFPGAASSFIDMLPDFKNSNPDNGKSVGNNECPVGDNDCPVGAVGYENVSTYYHTAGGLKLPVLSTDANATSYSNTSVILYQFGYKILKGQFAVALAVPYEWVKVNQTVTSALGRQRMNVVRNGFGDIEIFPLMMGWSHYVSPDGNGKRYPDSAPKRYADLKVQTQLGIYLPTGSFQKTCIGSIPCSADAANLGKNYWTFQPSAGFSYLSPLGEEFQ